MLIELHGKAGTLCQPAKEGQLHCPLIVRPTSEDNITSHLVQSLRLLNPRHWVGDFLNTALGEERFRRQVYRKFRIEPWAGKSSFPRELIPWKEGGTEVDIQITWENPPTTVIIECKYGSALSLRTSQNDGQHGYPGDQLIRNIRVGLHECGYYRTNALFETTPRNLAVILLTPETGNELVRQYRMPERLRAAIPQSDRIRWPVTPFVGEIGYHSVIKVLLARRHFATRTEKQVIDGLVEYLTHKHQTRPNRSHPPRMPDPDENSLPVE